MAQATAPSFTQKQAALFKNVASIEIGELKDSLAYAEYLLSQNVKEKEELLKINAEHTFQMQAAENKQRKTEKDLMAQVNQNAVIANKMQLLETQQKDVSAVFWPFVGTRIN